MEVNTRDDLDGDDRRGDPVNYEAERGPPPSIRSKLTSVLPQILEPVAGKAEDERPWRSRDGRGSDYDEDRCDIGLERDNDPASIGNREADVDRRDQYQTEGVDRRRIQPPEGGRRSRLDPPRRIPTSRGHAPAVCLQ
jgi:hypothetical protein